ncbi:amine oxidase [Rhizobium leguminosarum bv. trifolii]|uniref:Amine oxidase n=1 Tax=Rhizobium leguminosarum bv. trifolii TaxID=386 RepID=A0A3E1BQQ5_RHILT|nr:FAD-dependent oxidoreductase [Rhizobium leguminosarum]RFB94757.1 amine oxidase [Rhizobium leguminosarum bv. trifolii]RFB96129.1 amine oxidase [Rhizobium leguminosarum bv. trifolii]
MKACRVAVVGAGLAGLYAARALHASGIDVIVLEARDRLGGRILTADEAGMPAEDGFDLGPSWYWPQMQPPMETLIGELGLHCFAQNSEGDVIIERMSRERPQRYRPTMVEQQSMRLSGGTASAVRALARDIPADRIRRDATVTAMTLSDTGIELTVKSGQGNFEIFRVEQVVAALPPRLLEATVSFSPQQDPGTAARWRDTATWMAPHAKFFAVYDEPFWRTVGLSGTAQSMVGPLVEIHDATTASGKAALFGFPGVAADQRAALGEELLKQACLAQLSKLFGPAALKPRAVLLKDWAADPLTATAADRVGGGHPLPGNAQWVSGLWKDRLILAGSETSPSEPGYLAGAVIAAGLAVADILSKMDSR